MNELNREYTLAKRALFDKVYGERLNPRQLEAVFTLNGPLLVLAGAGSGKTTVLVNRIEYLIRYGNAYFSEEMPDYVTEETVKALRDAVNYPTAQISEILPRFITEPCPPWRVLAFTFTNKAAREIKDRLVKTLEDDSAAESVWAGTFHSICLRILHKYGDRVGLAGGFSIYDADDSKRLISACMKELDIDEKRLSPKVVASSVSSAKDKLVPPSEYEISQDPRSRDIKRIYERYQKRLSEYNAVDFDDIIMKTVQLLSSDDEARDHYQSKFRYVLVDEYQDTNYAQFKLTELLSGKYRNIMVVGDDDQSIYRFRGATVENILNFDKTYPDATVVKLEQNYRSTETILEAANSIIANNQSRHKKKLWCDRGRGEKITLREVADQNEEGRYIIDRINCGVSRGEFRYSDCAVLYRVNELARSLETSFAKSRVPYRVLGGMKFYDRKEIKDMLAYLSLVNVRTDDQRLKRIINEPKRKIGDATVRCVEDIARQTGKSMLDVIINADQYLALAKSADKLKAFAGIITSIDPSVLTPSEILIRLFENSGYKDMLASEGFEGEGKTDNVNELIAGAMEYERRCSEAGSEITLSGFLEEISLVSDIDKYDKDADAVVLMTVHSAKGLEFPVVFLAGMEDGIFPSEQNLLSESEKSEERRLAYVAITRAKDRLYISYAKGRTMYGRTSYNRLSCFIREEVPKELLNVEMPKLEPPRRDYGYQRSKTPSGGSSYFGGEVGRRSDMFSSTRRTDSSKFGIKRLEPGTAVSHQIFGRGVILSAKDLGGDVLYEVSFDTAGIKRLMATFANLTPITKK